jgi:cytochrome c oxidase cbb3-type subunit 4
MTIFLVVMLYSYIIYLYRSEKKGEKDYEKLGRIAIDDELDSTPVNTSSAEPSEKKE